MALFQSVKSEKHSVPTSYVQGLKSKLDANSGKLFAVDSSKPRALSALKALLSGEAPSSLVFIVQDEQVANEVQAVLETKNEGVALIKSANDMLSMLDKVGVKKGSITDTALKSAASAFKQTYPKIIVVAEANGETVLNSELCKDNTKNGVYNYDTDRVAPYCISDFISECKYSFAVIDNIYEIISFAEAGREEYKSPRKFEKIDFLGDSYYVDQKKSYKRLKGIVDSADKCIVLSDLIVDKNAVSLYAVLHMLHDSFETKEAKKYIQSRSEDLFIDCETMCATVSYCKDDENVLSMCLQYVKGTKQYVPRDIDSMSKFLEESFRFMTQQEILTKMAYLYAKKKTGLGASVDEINARLGESLEDVARCFCDAFFSDEIKAELEGALSTAHLCSMNKDEINRLISVFAKYAICADSPSVGDKCKVIRIYNESSAFEEIIRQNTPDFDKNAEYSYSTSQIGNEAIYKSIAVKDLIEAQTLGVSMKTPALIATTGDTKGICEIIKKLLKGYECSTDLSVLYSGSKTPDKAIVVVDYAQLRRTARYLNIKSVVFFDILPDINLFDSLIKKTLDMGDISAALLTSYTNMSGHMADAWEGSLFSDRLKVLPIRNSEVYVKGEVADDYARIIDEIEEMYVAFRELCQGGYDKSLAQLANKYHTLVATYTLNVTDTEKQMERDFKYFKRISEAYNCIFRNSFSIGANGEELRICNMELDNEGKSRRHVTEKRDEKDIPSAILFNACAKHMHRTCDIRVNDCGNCGEYRDYLTNNYKLFSAGVVEFFSLTEKIMQDLEDERRSDEEGGILHGFDDEEQQLFVNKIRESARNSSQRLMQIAAPGVNTDKLFYAPYDAVEAIRRDVNGIYTSLFGRYLVQLMEMFNTATDKMRKAFTIAGEGAMHQASAI